MRLRVIESKGTGAPSRGSMRARRIIFASWLLGAALVILVILVAPISLKAYDSSHPITVHCLVRSAISGDGSSRSVRGVGATYNQVRIDSPDCGTLFIRRHVTSGNAPKIAEKFQSGREYEFVVGAASYRFRDQLRMINQSIEVQPHD